MKHVLTRTLFATVAASALVGGCASFPGFTTPPFDTPRQTSTFTLGDLWPNAPESTIVPVAIPTNLPPYKVKEGEGGIPIEIPANAQQVNVASAILHIKLQSAMNVRLGFKFYMAKENPYSTAPIGEVAIGPGETRQVDAAFDTTLLKNPKIFSGVEVQVLQSDPAVVKRSDSLTATIWATVQLKLL